MASPLTPRHCMLSPSITQARDAEEDAKLATATVQNRSLRKWAAFNGYMKSRSEVVWVRQLGLGGQGRSGPWTDLLFPVTPHKITDFCWWLTHPPTNEDEADGPQGHSFSYTQTLLLDFIQWLETEELKLPVEGATRKGMIVEGGDVGVLRKATQTTLQTIAR